MGIAWYAAAHGRGELYELGKFSSWRRGLEAALGHIERYGEAPPQWAFVLAVTADACALHSDGPGEGGIGLGAADAGPAWWDAFYVAAQASALYDFCDWAGWETLAIVNDCDESLFELPGRWRVTRSTYTKTPMGGQCYGRGVGT